MLGELIMAHTGQMGCSWLYLPQQRAVIQQQEMQPGPESPGGAGLQGGSTALLQTSKLPAGTSPMSSDRSQPGQVRREHPAQLKGSEDHGDQTKSTLTLWLNMSVSCRSCVYWHRCCRIISTLSTSSLSSSWT